MASLERLAGDRATRSKAQADDAVSCKVEPTERPSLEVWTWDAVPRDRGTLAEIHTFSGAGLPMASSADGFLDLALRVSDEQTVNQP
jgi:hypothetical protein